MPKKKTKAGESASTEQVAFRAKKEVVRRLDGAADALGIDRSGLLRMMLIEFLPVVEERARQIKERAGVQGRR